MKRDLVNQKQPFGQHHDYMEHRSTMQDRPMDNKHPGRDMHVGNNGHDHILPINVNPYPGAYAEGEAHRENPFHWSGRPERG